jgi:hypothetical protein
MSRAVLGVFPPDRVGVLIEELCAAGVERASLSIVLPHREGDAAPRASSFSHLHELRVDGAAKLDGAGPVTDRAERLGSVPHGTIATRSSTSLIRAITREGIPEILAKAYVSELENGGAFLGARVPGGRVGKVVALMNRHTGRTIATAGDELEDDAAAKISSASA